MLNDPPDWKDYSRWFLGRDSDENQDTKEAWQYPIGKGGKLYRSALVAIRQRAGQQHATEIFEAAGSLLEKIDGKKAKDFGEGAYQPIEIFRTGLHMATNGSEISFSARDLEATARAYDPAVHEAPIVVGHPRMDDPAYGWVNALRYSGGALFADPGEVDPQFADLVRAGRYKKISASFYAPGAPQNPVPGVFYLRHVGFLGAQPPALKGLKPVAFADGDENFITLDFATNSNARRVRMAGRTEFHEGTGKGVLHHLRRLREHIMRKHGEEEADHVLPNEELQHLEEEARLEGEEQRRLKEEHDRLIKEGAKKTETAEEHATLSKREEEVAKREAEAAERERLLAEKEREARASEHAAYCEGLVKEGKLIPALKANALAILQFADSDSASQVLEFGEGASARKMVPVEAVKLLLSSLPKVVTYGESVGAGSAIPDGEDGLREAKIAEFMEKHKGTSYRDAMIEVSKECPQLFALNTKPKKAD
jgi:hypothetical protein